MGFSGFQAVRTVEDALRAFQEASGAAVYINGGTDVMVMARELGRFGGKLAVDISGLAGLKGISEGNDRLRIGAGCPHRSIADSPIICQYAHWRKRVRRLDRRKSGTGGQLAATSRTPRRRRTPSGRWHCTTPALRCKV